ncbi:MAG TPA: hypothetical protein VNU97_16190 [Rhizomicrobium sp.]|jgi:hypothetical protein|nr:hypothetical protein [Rhizomicrobium sp.]
MHFYGIAAAALAVLLATPALAAAPADCSKAAIPDAPVQGTVDGAPFVLKQAGVSIGGGFAADGVAFDSYDLTLEHDGIFNALTARVIVKQGTRADGRSFRVLPVDSVGAQPAAIAGVPEVQAWEIQLGDTDASFTHSTASMRIEFGQRKGNVLPGRIILCVPENNVTIAGTFEATIGR